MNSRLKLFSCILASVILCVACSTKPAVPEKPIPVVQVTTKPAPKPAETPASDVVRKPAEEQAPATKTPVTKTDVPAPAKKTDAQPVPAPKPEQPKKAPEKPAPQKVNPKPEKVAEPPPPPTPPAPEVKTIKFRCAFWTKPLRPYDVYVRSKGEFKRCQLFELVFSQEMTPELDEKGMVTVYRKVDGDYFPIFTVDTCGMDNLAAILLPKFNPDDPRGEYVQVLNLDEKEFPKGSLRVLNWAHEEIVGEVLFKSAGMRENFSLKCGEYFVSTPISQNREICEYSFFDTENPSRPIYTSAFSLFDWNQTMLFVLKNEEGNGFDFKMCKVR